jgi:hypothetical protein
MVKIWLWGETMMLTMGLTTVNLLLRNLLTHRV